MPLPPLHETWLYKLKMTLWFRSRDISTCVLRETDQFTDVALEIHNKGIMT